MNKCTEKLLSVLISSLIFFSSLTAFASPSVPIDIQDSKNMDKISMLMQLGIIKKTDDGFFGADTPVSRGEFNGMLAAITKKETTVASQAEMKSAEAVEKVLDLLGYGVLAKQQGYMKIANRLDLVPKGEILTREEAAVLIYNALETKMFEIVGFGETVKYSNIASDTLLKRYFGMKRIEGRIDANTKSAISPYNPTAEGSILIDGVKYLTADTGIEREIGRTVIAFVGDMGNFPENVYAYCCKYNTEDDVVINAADIVRNKTVVGEIYYETISGSIKKKTFSDDAIVIYNGEVLDRYNDSTFRITSGTIVLAASKNKKSEVVYINEYTTKIAEGANAYNYKVFFKYGEKPLEIDKDRCQLDVYVDGAKGSLEDISEFDAVDIFKSVSGDSVILEVTKMRITGIYEASDEKSIYIDGREYLKSGDIVGTEDFVLGEKYTFILNRENAVCGIDNSEQVSGEYGYLFKVIGSPDMYENGILLKFFTTANEFESFHVAKKFKINNIRFDIDEFYSDRNPLINNNIAVRQMVIYEKNQDGEIEAVYTASDNRTLNNTDADLRLDSKQTNANTRMYRNTFGINYRFSGNTQVFILPTAGNEEDETCYKCTNIGTWGEDHRFSNYEVYNTGRNRVIGAFVTYEDIKEEGYSENKQKANVVLVEKNVRIIDDDGIPCYKLTYYEAGEQKTAYFDNDEVCNAYPNAWDKYPKTITADDVKRGDIMQLVLDVRGRITEFHMLHRISDNSKDYSEILPSGYAYTADSVPLSYLYTAYGEIVDVYDGTVTVDVNNTNDPNNTAYHRNFKLESSTSYLLYSDGMVTKVSSGDIMLGDTVFVRAYNYIPYNIIVIR